jgi:hypothetical protein
MQNTNQTPETIVTFRLPTNLLAQIDHYCESQDLTRSQFVRRAVADRLNHVIARFGGQPLPPPIKPQQNQEPAWLTRR